MADQAELPGTGPAIPNVAGMWDYYLGGNENTDADREAARLVLGAAPDVPLAALENREFLKHAVRFLAAESGICQFIDIGPGLPTRGNVHQLAREHNPHARVAYVDNDPAVLTRGSVYLSGDARIVSGGLPGVLRVVGHLVQICIIPGQMVCLSALAYQGNHVVVVVAGASVSLFQVIASPDGSVPWVSGVLPGSVRDKKTVSNVAW